MAATSRRLLGRVLTYLVMLTIAAIFIFPFLWLVSTALKPRGGDIFAFPPQLIPRPPTLENFRLLFDTFPYLHYALNSSIVAVGTVALNLVLCSLAAYPLACMDFPGKDVIFYAILATMIIPFHAILIALFMICVSLNLVNSYLGAILPFTVTAYGVFLLRQAFKGIPHELLDAARIDGCGHLGIYFRIMLPLVKPALGAQALFTFVARWNSFLWPVVILQKEQYWTLQQGLAGMFHMFGYDWSKITAATVMVMLPIFLVFVALQRMFLEHYVTSGLKG